MSLKILVADDNKLSLEELKIWGKEMMPHYQIPKRIKVVEVIPRNAMGKVNKKELIKNLLEDWIWQYCIFYPSMDVESHWEWII